MSAPVRSLKILYDFTDLNWNWSILDMSFFYNKARYEKAIGASDHLPFSGVYCIYYNVKIKIPFF